MLKFLRRKKRRRYSGVILIERFEGQWDRSEFPHPLVTLDFGADGTLLAVAVAGENMKIRTDTEA